MEKDLTFNIIKRSSGESRLVSGCAIKFNSDSKYIGFIETIKPEAVTEELLNRSDIFVYLDHQKERGVLARSNHGKGSLKLDLREDGLYYSFEAPNTQLGDELLSYLDRGEITASSFAFTVSENGDKWYKDSEGNIRRDVSSIDRLFDCSPVFTPAYAATSCQRRKIDEINKNDKELSELWEKFHQY